MKTIKKALALILTLAIVMSLGITAFAAKATDYSFTVTNTLAKTNIKLNENLSAYRVFDVKYSGSPNPADSKTAYTYTVCDAFRGLPLHAADDDVADYTTDPLTWNGKKAGTPKECEELIAALTAENADIYDFAKTVLDYMNAHGKHVAQPGSDQTIDFSALKVDGVLSTTPEVPSDESPLTEQKFTFNTNNAGYYIVLPEGKSVDGSQTVIAAAGLDTTNNKFDIKVKAEAPKLTKEIKNAAGETVPESDVQIGDKVTFVINSKFPNMTGYKTYDLTLHDTLSAGLTFDKSSVKVYINNDASGHTLTAGADQHYVVAEKNRIVDKEGTENDVYDTFSVKLNDLVALKAEYASDETIDWTGDVPITVEYQATVNSGSLTKLRDNNKAYLDYHNNPYKTDSYSKTPDEVVYLYNFDLDVDKYAMVKNPEWKDDATGHENDGKSEFLNTKLDGAQFRLYQIKTVDDPLDDGDKTIQQKQYYKTDVNASNPTKAITWDAVAENATIGYTKVVKIPATEPVQYKTKLVTYKSTDAEHASPVDFKFAGLAAGTYYLEEIVAPEGYANLKNPIKVTITPTYFGETHAQAGKLEKVQYSFTYTNNQGGTGTVTPDAITVTDGSTGVVSNTAHISMQVPVLNTAGGELPSTGGVGTTIFYTVGALMMVSALVLLITKKKMSV